MYSCVTFLDTHGVGPQIVLTVTKTEFISSFWLSNASFNT